MYTWKIVKDNKTVWRGFTRKLHTVKKLGGLVIGEAMEKDQRVEFVYSGMFNRASDRLIWRPIDGDL